ncbi:ParA family ATPase [Caballeronia arvi]|uniref:ParA family ATPase n=1 Tax=Caballeronia arvi TaxID=1777135 RepID=A0A158KNG7_9BURK|nr:ParA family protein [Caballeronia arvi]SAL82624.1 ParA family ATPase [Caballeronia arvi]
MPVLVIANSKGGTGRTTLAGEISVGLGFRRGGRVVLADLCREQTLRAWWAERSDPNPQMFDGSNAQALRQWLAGDAISDGSWVIVDTPSHDLAATAAAISLADFVLIPVGDTAFEMPPAIRTAAECVRLEKRFAFVFTRVGLSRETVSWLLQLVKHGPMLEAFIRNLSAYGRLDRPGLSVFDAGGDKEAREDMLQVVECVLDEFPDERRFARKGASIYDIQNFRRWAGRGALTS